MMLYIGSDHRGFHHKESLKAFLKDSGYSVTDVGAERFEDGDDYVDFARRVAEKISADPMGARGILLCGSGVGVDVVANKYPFVRSSLCFSTDQAFAARSDDDANVLSIAADHLNPEQAKQIASVWLQTPFSEEERHRRRLAKIRDIENRTSR